MCRLVDFECPRVLRLYCTCRGVVGTGPDGGIVYMVRCGPERPRCPDAGVFGRAKRTDGVIFNVCC